MHGIVLNLTAAIKETNNFVFSVVHGWIF